MAAKQKRDSDYYLDRLKADYPAIYTDYLAGVYPSVRSACVSAGLRKPMTGLSALKSAWDKASPAERAQFIAMIGSTPAAAGSCPIAVGGKLLPSAITAIHDKMARRNLKMGDVMKEIGFKPLNASLGRALVDGTTIRPTLITALERWLLRNP